MDATADDDDLREKWQRIFETDARSLQKYCAAIIRDHPPKGYDASDLVQEAFLAAGIAMINGTEIQTPRAYLKTTARRTARRLNERLDQETEMDDDNNVIKIERRTEEQFRADGNAEFLKFQLRELLTHLSERDQTILRMQLEGWPSKEIANTLETTEDAINTKLSKIRATLRNQLTDGRA
jgi:RNA polymerase sigma factor (sigma-70 family)